MGPLNNQKVKNAVFGIGIAVVAFMLFRYSVAKFGKIRGQLVALATDSDGVQEEGDLLTLGTPDHDIMDHLAPETSEMSEPISLTANDDLDDDVQTLEMNTYYEEEDDDKQLTSDLSAPTDLDVQNDYEASEFDESYDESYDESPVENDVQTDYKASEYEENYDESLAYDESPLDTDAQNASLADDSNIFEDNYAESQDSDVSYDMYTDEQGEEETMDEAVVGEIDFGPVEASDSLPVDTEETDEFDTYYDNTVESVVSDVSLPEYVDQVEEQPYDVDVVDQSEGQVVETIDNLPIDNEPRIVDQPVDMDTYSENNIASEASDVNMPESIAQEVDVNSFNADVIAQYPQELPRDTNQASDVETLVVDTLNTIDINSLPPRDIVPSETVPQNAGPSLAIKVPSQDSVVPASPTLPEESVNLSETSNEAPEPEIEPLAPCGQVCAYRGRKVTRRPRAPYQQITKNINCENVMKRMAYRHHKITSPPPRKPPKALLDEFTQNGEVYMHPETWYFDNTKSPNAIDTWGVDNITEYTDRVAEGLNINSYHDGGCALETVKKYAKKITNTTGVVIGTIEPWLESLLLASGARHVTTLEYNTLQYDHPQLSIADPFTYAERYLRGETGLFDFAASFSSIEHSGLGRYGDPINPYGDMEAMAQVYCMMKPGGTFVLGIPGPGAYTARSFIKWNAHRMYGRERLPHLTANWKFIDYRDCKGLHFILVLTKPKK